VRRFKLPGEVRAFELPGDDTVFVSRNGKQFTFDFSKISISDFCGQSSTIAKRLTITLGVKRCSGSKISEMRIDNTRAFTKAVLAAALICTDSLAIAETPSPDAVSLEGGRVLLQNGRKLIEVDAATKKELPLRFPASVKRAISTASSIGFPVDKSRVIDGKEYELVVINQSSSNNPMGYCRAGEEGTLYVLQIEGQKAELRFSLPVQSCPKSISLDTETGTRPPYLAITWNDTPAGINVAWEHVGEKGRTNRLYRFRNGIFLAVGQ
jgi:hypothetical protein